MKRHLHAAMALTLTACVAGACASKPTAQRNAAPAYKVGATGAALSAAAGDPSALAQVQRQRGLQARSPAGRPAGERQALRRAAAAPARDAPARSAASEAPVQTAASSASAGSGGAQPAQTPVALKALTVASALPTTVARAPAASGAAAVLASPPAALRWALYVLAGLALLGIVLAGLGALVSAARKRAAGSGLAPVPLPANDPEVPVRKTIARLRGEPPPPQVTIRAGALG